MCHANWSALVAAGEPVKFFGVIPFYLVSYSSTVIPVILVIIVQSFVEKWLNKVIPKAVNLVFVPMFTFLIMGTLALSVLGPVGDYVGEGLAMIFDWLSTNASWAPAALIGGLFPVMVMFGMVSTMRLRRLEVCRWQALALTVFLGRDAYALILHREWLHW